MEVNKVNEKVNCFTLNCHSVVNKDVFIGQILREEKVDFALLTETWFSNEKQHQFETSDLNQNGYKLSVANRRNKLGGGIALTCKTGIKSRLLKHGTLQSFEYGIWQLIFKSITLHVVGIYRPPSLATDSQFIADFFQFMEDVITRYTKLMVMGDFNLHVNKTNTITTEFNNSLSAMGLEQHVNFSTHTGGNTLDLVITEIVNGVEIERCQQGQFVSDHCLVKIVTKVKKENISSETVTFRNFKDLECDEFKNDLSRISLNHEDINECVDQFQNEMQTILDSHAPVQEKTKICRAPRPWFTEKICNLKRRVRKTEHVWRKHRKPNQYEEFKSIRNNYHHELRQEKISVLSEKVISTKGDSKQLYNFVSAMTGTKSDNPLPDSESDDLLAENFADFFMSKIGKIRDSLKTFPDYKPETKDVPPLTTFIDLTQENVKQLISELQTKSCELDILPTKILKLYIDQLLPQITNLVNLSLQQGIFPSKWKQAIVRPLLKKAGLELEYANYRPVSNLSFLSKLVEKAALSILNSHANENNLLPKNQSAYRQFHSCETALLRLVNDLLAGMENQEVNALIAIDLSAAFDTVDHNILLDVLKNQYGLGGTTLNWIDSYLRPRSCIVSVNSCQSSPRPLDCSVPQGSCLGPWLYLTYAGTLFDVIPKSISLYGFADDHIANKQFHPSSIDNETTAIQELEECAVDINTWMNQNKLKMNTTKTEFIMFGSKAQLNKCTTKSINIAGDIVQSESSIRYLGAFLDETLNFQEHVKRKCRSAMINFLRIKSIRKYLSMDATEILLLSLVISHLDYCNVILFGIAQTELKKMQRIQNMCAKLVLNRRKYDSSKQALLELHWLPIKTRITYKLLTYMYNCSVERAPRYLIELLETRVPKRPLRSSVLDSGCYETPFNKRKTFSDRSFSFIGPKLWNSLPVHIRQSPSVECFKKELKTYYFKDFYALF